MKISNDFPIIIFASAQTIDIMLDFSSTLLFKKITELAQVSEESLKLLFDACIIQKLTKDTIVLKPGQVCKQIHFVEEGFLRTFIATNGTQINRDFSFENTFVTDLKSLVTEKPSDVTIKTEEDTILFSFKKVVLLDLYRQSSDIESFGRKLLEQLLISQEENTNRLRTLSAVAHYQYLQKNYPQLLQRVSLLQIASYLGVARETLSRIRKIK